jgi:hypothetical protein
MMEENDNQHHQLFLLRGQPIVSSSEGNSKQLIYMNSLFYFYILIVNSIELSNIVDDIDNNSDSGISPNDSEAEVLIYDRES